jgi:hypothetical protein
MGFTKKNLGIIPVTLTYQVFDAETGELTGTNECKFKFRRRTNEEAKLDVRDETLDEAVTESVLKRFSKLLIEEPIGFDDFPDGESQMTGKSLEERAYDYFKDPEMFVFADHAMTIWWRRVAPPELFR